MAWDALCEVGGVLRHGVYKGGFDNPTVKTLTTPLAAAETTGLKGSVLIIVSRSNRNQDAR